MPAHLQFVATEPAPNVLLVQPDAIVLEATRCELEDLGVPVCRAAFPHEAPQALADGCAELTTLFLDLDTGERGRAQAYALAEAARRTHPGLAVIYTSAVRPSDFERRRVQGGAFLQKPYTVRELAELVRRPSFSPSCRTASAWPVARSGAPAPVSKAAAPALGPPSAG